VYDGVEFKDLSAEQQGEVAEMIGAALTLNAAQTRPPRDPTVPFTAENLAEAMGFGSNSANLLPVGVYDIFLRAHEQLRR